MKKLLLTLAAVLSVFSFAAANEVTFDFTTNQYGQAIGTNETPNYLTDGTTLVEAPATITVTTDNMVRFWSASTGTQFRIQKGGAITIAVAQGTISKLVVEQANANGNSFTANGAVADNADKGGKSTPLEWSFATPQASIAFAQPSNGKGTAQITKITITYTGGGEVVVVDKPEIKLNADNKIEITYNADAAYYTTDGTNPTSASTKYTAPFAVAAGTTVKAVAYKGTAASPVAEFTVPAEIDGLAAFISAKPDKATEIVCPISVIYSNGRNTYLKDNKGAYLLSYNSGDIEHPEFKNGSVLASITGTYKDQNGLPEIIPTAFGTVSEGAAVQPEEVAVEELSMDMLNTYVKITGVTISAVNGKNFTITDATGTVAGYNTFTGNYYNPNVTVEEGDNFTLIGFVSCYKTTLQVTPVSIEGGTVLEPVATPAFSQAAGAYPAGTKVEITCATAGASIFYTLDGTNPTIASTEYTAPIVLDASCTLKAIAVKEGMADSEIASAAYDIVAAGQTIVAFDFTTDGVKAFTTANIEASNVQEDTDANNLSGVNFTNGFVTIWIEKGEGNSPRWWKGNQGDTEARFYNKNTLRISVNTNGYKITSIDFVKGFGNNFAAGDKLGTVTPADGTWNGRVWTPAADAIVTDLTWTPGATCNVGKFNVTLAEDAKATSGVENIEAADDNAPAEYYNLQGVRVANPTPGLYIVRQGNKVSKTIIR